MEAHSLQESARGPFVPEIIAFLIGVHLVCISPSVRTARMILITTDLMLIRRPSRGRNHGRMPEKSDGSRDLPLSRLSDAVICRVQSTGESTGRLPWLGRMVIIDGFAQSLAQPPRISLVLAAAHLPVRQADDAQGVASATSPRPRPPIIPSKSFLEG